MDKFKKDIYYSLLDFLIYLYTSINAQKNHTLKLNYQIMDKNEVREMFKDLNFYY